MHWIDWLLVTIPILVVIYIGFHSQRYVRGVSDFLSAGRVAGRYVLCIASEQGGFGLVSLIAIHEIYYQSGFAYGFWNYLTFPITVIFSLVGYCTYRFRETRAMTLGQFFEIRYSRQFRIFAGILQSISGIINYGVFPAVGARFFVYFCGLPVELELFGWVFPTFALIMAFILGLAVLISALGGQITIMTTDCIQGILMYPMYVVIVLYLLFRFSWFQDMAPAMLDRDPGKSMLNPFDISQLRDFNLFYILVGLVASFVNRMAWSGQQGYSGAGRNAHEQKMGGVLGYWRVGFSSLMIVLLGIVGFTYLNSDKFQSGPRGAVACRTELALKAAQDIMADSDHPDLRRVVLQYLDTGQITPQIQSLLDQSAALKAAQAAQREKFKYLPADQPQNDPAAAPTSDSPLGAEQKHQLRESRMHTARDAIHALDPASSQTFATIFAQMRVPMAFRYIMPIGITGIFCALCFMLLITTDTTMLHSWGSILIQDVILPFRQKPFSPRQHLRLLRLAIAFVALFAFFFSFFFGQVDYLVMFMVITGAIWLGGSGACIVGGLYWKRGTAAGAWAALISGSGLALLSILVQKYWVSLLYPWLFDLQMIDTLAAWLQAASAPFEPIIKWRMSSEKFPINSQELYALNLFTSIALYILVSLFTSRKPFNMDRMLHRGLYHREGQKLQIKRMTLRNLIPSMVGIDNQYSRGDKIIAWSVFLWNFGWVFGCTFLGVLLWNLFSPWSNQGWSRLFFLNHFLIGGAIGVVSTFWFTIGGVLDLRRLFKDLAAQQQNVLDDGRVVGHISADDLDLVEKVEHQSLEPSPADKLSPDQSHSDPLSPPPPRSEEQPLNQSP